MGIRVGAVAGTAALLFLSAPAVASACAEPSQADLGTVSGRAGDTVSFALPGTPRGARYAITVEGSPAGGGRDDDAAPGTQAALTIPDLGPAVRAVQAIVTVECDEGGGWQRSLAVRYEGRPAPAPSGDAQALGPPAEGGAAGPASNPPSARPKARGPRSSRGSGEGGGVKGVRRSFAGLGPAVLEVTKTRERARSGSRGKERRKPRRKARRLQTLDQDGTFAPPAVSGGGADLSGGDVGIPGPPVAWKLLVAAALAGLGTIVLVARRTRRRRMLAG